MSDNIWAASAPGTVGAFAPQRAGEAHLAASASAPIVSHSEVTRVGGGSQSAPAYPSEGSEHRHKKKRKHTSPTDPPADGDGDVSTHGSRRSQRSRAHKEGRARGGAGSASNGASVEEHMNVSDYNSEIEEAKLAAVTAAARGADPRPSSPPASAPATTRSAADPVTPSSLLLTASAGAARHLAPVAPPADTPSSPKNNVFVSEAGLRSAGSARASRSPLASAGSPPRERSDGAGTEHGAAIEEAHVSVPNSRGAGSQPRTDTTPGRAPSSAAPTEPGFGMPPLPSAHLSDRARRASLDTAPAIRAAYSREVSDSEVELPLKSAPVAVVYPHQPASAAADEEAAFSPRSPVSTDIAIDAPNGSEKESTARVPVPPPANGRTGSSSVIGRIRISTTLPSDSTATQLSSAYPHGADLDQEMNSQRDVDRARAGGVGGDAVHVHPSLHNSQQRQTVYPLHVSEGSDWSHLEQSSEEEDADDGPKQPFASCCVDRSNPDAWRQNPIRRNGLQRPLHLLQIIAFVIKFLGLGLYSSAVLPGYILLYSDGHHDCLAELIVFTVCLYGSFLALAFGWTVVTFMENGDSTNQGEVCMYCRRKTDESSKHCKACNKCVMGFDHHCKWLNMCIGERNYRYFMVYVVSSVACLLTAFVAGIVIVARWWHELSEHNTYFRVAPILLSLLMFVAAPPLLHLLGFHIMLNIHGQTTYERIQLKRERRDERALRQESQTADKKKKSGPFACTKDKTSKKDKSAASTGRGGVQPLHGSSTAIPVRS